MRRRIANGEPAHRNEDATQRAVRFDCAPSRPRNPAAAHPSLWNPPWFDADIKWCSEGDRAIQLAGDVLDLYAASVGAHRAHTSVPSTGLSLVATLSGRFWVRSREYRKVRFFTPSRLLFETNG